MTVDEGREQRGASTVEHITLDGAGVRLHRRNLGNCTTDGLHVERAVAGSQDHISDQHTRTLEHEDVSGPAA